MPKNKPDKSSNCCELRGDNPNPRNSDDKRNKLSSGFANGLFCDFGKRANIKIVNRFAEECCLEPESNSANAKPPKCSKADAFGARGNAHGC